MGDGHQGRGERKKHHIERKSAPFERDGKKGKNVLVQKEELGHYDSLIIKKNSLEINSPTTTRGGGGG